MYIFGRKNCKLSIRYFSSGGSSSNDNCLLSDRDVSRLVSEDNLVADPDWDLYARLESGYNCRSTQNGRDDSLVTSCRLFNFVACRLLPARAQPLQTLHNCGQREDRLFILSRLLSKVSSKGLLQHIQLWRHLHQELPALRSARKRYCSERRLGV